MCQQRPVHRHKDSWAFHLHRRFCLNGYHTKHNIASNEWGKQWTKGSIRVFFMPENKTMKRKDSFDYLKLSINLHLMREKAETKFGKRATGRIQLGTTISKEFVSVIRLFASSGCQRWQSFAKSSPNVPVSTGCKASFARRFVPISSIATAAYEENVQVTSFEQGNLKRNVHEKTYR